MNFDLFDNYISLGYFCGIAQDLEKMGLRNQSSPFDWVISSLEYNMKAIDNRFDGFLEYENLSQNINHRDYYKEDRYHMLFFHDFDKYKSLDEQYQSVKNKYDRRIERFLESIQKPTLFIRYISTENTDEHGKSIELDYIEKNIGDIENIIKKYNKNNKIIFIGDGSLTSNTIKIYNVEIDENDKVARSPIIKNVELFPLLDSVNKQDRAYNISRYINKERKRKNVFREFVIKVKNYIKKRILKEYKHTKTYDVFII